MPADALPSAPTAVSAAPEPGPVGSLRLLTAFRREQSDPGTFYRLLARDSVALVARHARLDESRVVDVGGGAGYFADAFRERGAQCLLVEPDSAELCIRGVPSRASVIGDGYWLPLGEASVDVCFSCNVLEHVRDPAPWSRRGPKERTGARRRACRFSFAGSRPSRARGRWCGQEDR